VEWTGFGMLVGAVHVYYLTAVVPSLIAATATNYVLSARFVFVRGRHSPFKEVLLLYLVCADRAALQLDPYVAFCGAPEDAQSNQDRLLPFRLFFHGVEKIELSMVSGKSV